MKNPALVIFDFEKAYDMVPIELLVKKLIDFDIPRNIIATIRDMLEKFRLNFKGMTIKTEKGLDQGSWLSPLLFNIFINDLLNKFEEKGIECRAYADDIVCICNEIEKWEKNQLILLNVGQNQMGWK